MPLKGTKPSLIKKRLKAFFYGDAGVGKTIAAIQFPSPYLIDTEKGSVNDKYVEILEKNNGVVFHTSDIDDIITEIKALLTEKHSFKTLIIDPLTCVYDQILDQSSEKGTEFGRHYVEAKKKMKHLFNLILRLDMNVVITSHSKNEYGTNMSLLGSTWDCYKKVNYVFDVLCEVKKIGKERIGIVKKSRIDEFEEDSSFKFSYDEIEKRYGKDKLEKEVIPEKLANEEQIKEIKNLIVLLSIPEKSVQKWLLKEKSETFDEVSFDFASKLMDHLYSLMKEKYKTKE